MKRARHTPEPILAVLRQAEAGTPVAELCRKVGITEGTFYRWKKQVGAQAGGTNGPRGAQFAALSTNPCAW